MSPAPSATPWEFRSAPFRSPSQNVAAAPKIRSRPDDSLQGPGKDRRNSPASSRRRPRRFRRRVQPGSASLADLPSPIRKSGARISPKALNILASACAPRSPFGRRTLRAATDAFPSPEKIYRLGPRNRSPLDRMAGRIAEPDLRFPRDGLPPEHPEIREGADADGAGGASGQRFLQFDDPLRRHGTGDRLDQKQPVPPGIVEHDVRQLVMAGDPEFGQAGLVDEQILPGRISEVGQARAVNETGRARPQPSAPRCAGPARNSRPSGSVTGTDCVRARNVPRGRRVRGGTRPRRDPSVP